MSVAGCAGNPVLGERLRRQPLGGCFAGGRFVLHSSSGPCDGMAGVAVFGVLCHWEVGADLVL